MWRGLILATSAAAKPQAPRRLHVGFMTIASAIGRAIFGVALLLLYYVVFTPLGLLLRLLGRDALDLRNRPNQATYWKPKSDSDGLRAP